MNFYMYTTSVPRAMFASFQSITLKINRLINKTLYISLPLHYCSGIEVACVIGKVASYLFSVNRLQAYAILVDFYLFWIVFLQHFIVVIKQCLSVSIVLCLCDVTVTCSQVIINVDCGCP